MKILYLNSADIEGGAARATTRLMQGVHAQGADARLHVQRKYSDNLLVDGPRTMLGKVMGFARPTLEQFICGINPDRTSGPFCSAFLPDRLSALLADEAPNIVHLHWVARMMRLETLSRFMVPIVWTMHDSWAFTGGCYLPLDCTRYRESCGECPVLGSSREDDLSHRVWQRKRQSWQGLDLTIIAPSNWMAACAQASSLFSNTRIEVIPNAMDVERYKPVDKQAARDSLSLPQGKRLVLFGAKNFTKDRNKGFHLLGQALREMARRGLHDSVELVTFGSTEMAAPGLSLKVRDLGLISDETLLVRLYSAADIFVLPSIQESLGYTVMEAMSCGTPCVAFNQGGVPDLIEHQHNGYLAQPFEPADLAQGINWVLESEDRRKELSRAARQKVAHGFAVGQVAERHIALYRELLKHE